MVNKMDNQQVITCKEIDEKVLLENLAYEGVEEILLNSKLSEDDNKNFIADSIGLKRSELCKKYNLTVDQVKKMTTKLNSQRKTIIPEGFKECPKNNKYLVTPCGLVANKTTRKILKPVINTKGYIQMDGPGKIHRCVAEAFIPNINDKPQVNHIDGVKTNNNVENLEWATNAENAKHKKENNLGKTVNVKLAATGSNNTQSKLDETIVGFIRSTSLSSSELSSIFEVSKATINDVRSKRTWKHI